MTRSFQVKTEGGEVDLLLPPGHVLVLAGPNGVGKSSLLHRAARSFGPVDKIEILSGFRSISFQSPDIDHVGMPTDQLFQQLSMESPNTNRYRNSWGEQHLKSVLKRFVNRQNQDNEDIVNEARKSEDPASIILGGAPRILDVLNRVFSQARLPVEIIMSDGMLQAKRDGAIYGIDRMSDGERAALLLVCAILIRPYDSAIAIDEPEKHLNPSISSPLLAASIRARPDLGYIIATHDLRISDSLLRKTIIHVVDSRVISESNGREDRNFKVNIIEKSDGVDEALQVAILGARKAALFVEGQSSSFDRVVYSIVYPNHSVVARGGWEAVLGDVRALRANSSYHHIHLSGLIDRDGRDDIEVSAHEIEGVYSTKLPTIENIFFLEEVMVAMATARRALIGGAAAEEVVANAKLALDDHLARSLDDIKNRRSVWKINRSLSSQKVSVRNLRGGFGEKIQVEVGSIIADESENIDGIIKNSRGFDILKLLPIKNTSIPSALSHSLGFSGFQEYQTAVVRQMESGNEYGQELVRLMREYLPEIAYREG